MAASSSFSDLGDDDAHILSVAKAEATQDFLAVHLAHPFSPSSVTGGWNGVVGFETSNEDVWRFTHHRSPSVRVVVILASSRESNKRPMKKSVSSFILFYSSTVTLDNRKNLCKTTEPTSFHRNHSWSRGSAWRSEAKKAPNL